MSLLPHATAPLLCDALTASVYPLLLCAPLCLSLLGTWSGTPWSAKDSTLLQVLVSVQSMILGTAHPYFNEPGFQSSQGTPHGDAASAAYNASVREATARYAVLDALSDRRLQEGFDEVVRAHFSKRAPRILSTLQAWRDDAELRRRKQAEAVAAAQLAHAQAHAHSHAHTHVHALAQAIPHQHQLPHQVPQQQQLTAPMPPAYAFSVMYVDELGDASLLPAHAFDLQPHQQSAQPYNMNGLCPPLEQTLTALMAKLG